MILVDANILMYAAGASHRNKASSVAFLTRVSEGTVAACLSTEILQEILHRYRAINRWNDGKEVFLLSRQIVPEILSIDRHIVNYAYDLLERYPAIMARDAIHAATCMVNRLDGICSFDDDFDGIRGLKRYKPDDLS